MTSAQKVIKYIAIAFAIFLIITIISTVLSAIYGISAIFRLGKDETIINEEMSELIFEDNEIATLEIDIAYTNLTIKTGEKLQAETNNSKITCKQTNNKLHIKENSSNNWFGGNEIADLIIYVPENIEFETINIAAGAGTINIEILNTKSLEFELGAGKTEINNLNVSKECKIEGGAGQLKINSGTINDLDLDMGVGEVNLTSTLTGKNEIDAGVGNLNINLLGDKDSYQISTEKGLGTIKIDGKDAQDEVQYGDGENHIEINGGVGNILVKFE